MKPLVSRLSLALALAAIPSASHAVNYVWNGNNADWSTPSEWTPAGPPTGGGGNYAIINSGTANLTSNAASVQDILVNTTGIVNGTGTVNHTAGSISTTGWTRMGRGTGGMATYNLSGTGSLTTGRLIVAESSNANFAMTGGTLQVNGELWVGGNAGATGQAGTFTYSGGTATATSWLAVGRNSTGTLTVTNGTMNVATTGGNVTIGSSAGAIGTVNVAGGTLATPNAIWVSESGGIATVNVTAGTLSATGGTAGMVVVTGVGQGTVNLDGGTISVRTVSRTGSGTATFNFNGGVLQARATGLTLMGGLSRANVRNGGAVIDTQANNVTISQSLLHSDIIGDAATDGGLIKNGTGALTLSGPNAYTGVTTVTAGTLRFANEASLYNNNQANWTSANLQVATGASVVLNAGGAGEFTAAGLGVILGGAMDGFATGTTLGLDTTNAATPLVLASAIANPNGGANVLSLTKLGTGTLTLTGANSYTGATSVTAGVLTVSGGGTLAPSTALSVGSGAAFNYLPATTGSTLTVSTMNLAGGSRVGMAWDASTSSQIAATGAATVGTGVGLGLVGTPTSGTAYTVLTAASGLDSGSYYLLNPVDYTAVIAQTATDVKVTPTAATALGAAYWKGGFSNIWAASDGSAQSNWVASASGAAQPLTPGSGADVFISADTPAAPTGTVLGANMTIKSLTIQDTTNGLGLNADGNTLTIAGASGITMNTGVPASTIAANVALGIDQTWTNNSANALTVSGGISGASNLTKDGTGTVTLSGPNTFTGAVTITAGTLEIGGAGYLGGGTYAGTISNAGTLRVGTSANQTLSGTISGSGALTKAGTGTLTLADANGYTGVTTVAGGILSVGTLANGGTASSIGASTANAANLVLNGGTLSYTGASTTIDRGFTIAGTGSGISTVNDLTMTGPVASTGGNLIKTGPGNLILTNPGANVFGTVNQGLRVNGGTLTLDGSGTQTNAVASEMWLGAIPDVPANVVLNNTSLTTASWLAMGRGNGSATTTLTATNSKITTVNFSAGYNNALPNNDSDQIISLTNSTWTNGGNTYLAESLNSATTMTLAGASAYSSTSGTAQVQLGIGPNTAATMTLAGTSTFTSASRILIGRGAGSVSNVTIQDGAAMTKTGEWLSIGTESSAVATVTVKGNGALTSTTGDFNIGDIGTSTGTLNIQGNGTVTSAGTVFVGKGATTSGTLDITGGSFTCGSWISIGRYWTAATGARATGVVNVSGGTFNQTNTANALIVGEEGSGTLNVSGTGAVVVSGATLGLSIGHTASGIGTVNLDGGTITTTLVRDGGGTSTFNFNGGTLIAGTGANPSFMGGLNNAIVKSGGANIDSNGQMIAIGQALLDGGGGGGLVKSGAGTLTLTGTNTYTGPTTVAAGVLAVNGSIATSSLTTVDPLATLQGTGTVGTTVVADIGHVAPGNSIGTLTISGSMTINGTLDVEYDDSLTGQKIDLLAVSGILDISLATVDFADISTGPVGLSGIAYIFATYGTLTGSQFASVVDLPAGYTIDYAYSGNNIALVPEPTAALLGALGLLGLLRRRRA